MPAHKHPRRPRAVEPPWRIRTGHPSAPPRDVRVVDLGTRSYRAVSLYRFLRADSQAYPPDPHDIRLKFEGRDPIEVRTQIAEFVADRRRIYEAVHAGEPVTIPRWRVDSHIWAAEVEHIPWLRDRDSGVDWFEVDVDDVVSPADGPVA
jgi:hypothetical protein